MNSDSMRDIQQRALVARLSDDDWPVATLYRSCLAALRQEDLQGIYVSWMMSLVFVQSQGKAYFEPGGQLLTGRVNKMPYATNAERRDWLKFITVSGGKWSGCIPKFEYDAKLKYCVEAYPASSDLPFVEQMICCCRWGISQMPGIMFWLKPGSQTLLSDYRRFVACPDLQLRVLAKWLRKEALADGASLEKTFSKFFYEPGSMTKEPRAEIGLALNAGFSEFIASRGLVQCLYQPAFSE